LCSVGRRNHETKGKISHPLDLNTIF